VGAFTARVCCANFLAEFRVQFRARATCDEVARAHDVNRRHALQAAAVEIWAW